MTSKCRAARGAAKRPRGETPEPGLVRLPAEVLDPDLFLLAPGGPVEFDLSDTIRISAIGLAGLVNVARGRCVTLRLAGGPVQDKLLRVFTGALKPCSDPDLWTLYLPPPA